MIVVMRSGFAPEELEGVVNHVEEAGLRVHLSRGEAHAIVGVIGMPITDQLREALEVLPGVEQVLRVSKRYKLASRDFHPEPTQVQIGRLTIGGDAVPVIAGPCSVEGAEEFLSTAEALREAGAVALRGGAFKPRTSPYEFRGLGERGLQIMAEARERTGLPIVTEVMAPGTCRWSRSMPMSSRSAHATRRITNSWRRRVRQASRCCSSVACRCRLRSGCWRRSTSWPAAVAT